MPDTPKFDKAALAWTLPWEDDWVTAVAILGPTRRLAAGNNLGQILVWELPEKLDAPLPHPVRDSMDTPMSSADWSPRRTAAG